ncbi:hypothetical protein [Streptomyces sp. NPDC046371]|uniref:hypothetical protein n=1 Tax=Streptomyces sp. NPDC046371 TaxID=3154916 RepID=UPI0033D3041C
MYRHTVDYSQDRPDRRVLLNRGFFLGDLPRLVPLCRARGHKPVVDGYDSQYGDRERSRWVICDRCGVRPEPQGHLDADLWNIGQPYTGPFNPSQPTSPTVRRQLVARGFFDEGIRLPGSWPNRPTGGLGAQLIIGRSRTVGAGVKVGNAGSEQTLAAHLGLGPLGALFLHTERHGTVLQRRLNPTGYDSRIVDAAFHHGKVWWSLWARRDEHRSTDPIWQRGSANINPAHYLLGERIAEVLEETKADGTVYLPDGTSYPVTLRLEKWQRGRRRGRKFTNWSLVWDCPGGIPVRNHSWKGDNTLGGSLPIQSDAADSPQWAAVACALIAASCADDRARYGYQPAV